MPIEEINLNLGKPDLTVISKSDSGSINLSKPATPTRSVNFGPGAEMLMNPKREKSATSPRTDINISDLGDLDNLNLNEQRKKNPRPSFTDVTSNIFEAKPNAPNIKLNINEPPSLDKPLENMNNKSKVETDDGFKKFNEIPVAPSNPPSQPKLSREQELREKLSYLRKLEALQKKGITMTKQYTMDSPLDEMKGEFEMIKADREKKSSVKFQQKMMMAFVSGLEFLNGKFDPFDLKLDGWSEAVNENVDDYDDVFGELHEKYGGSAKIAPELKLIFMLGGSAAMLHMTNTMFKSSMPGMDDIMRQNPELMQQFTNAAMNSMNQSNPGFGGFMSGVMGGPQMSQMPPMGSPQGPDENARRNPPRMPQRSNRPEVPPPGRSSRNYNDGVNVKDNYQRVKSRRAEMKGPSNIDDLLSGLKTKKINIGKDDSSVVSLKELDEMNASLEKPKKSRRKPKSERNTVSLNL
jgi:hypothetical protein